MTIVYRTIKGEMLTHEELDGNFSHLDTNKEPVIQSKGTAFNKNFGTTADTVSEGQHNHAKLTPASDSTTAIQLTKADGTTPVLTIDTTNSKALVNYLDSTMTVDQNTTPTINAVQTAATLQDDSAATGVSEEFNTTYKAIKFTASGDHNIRSFGVRLKCSATLTNPTSTMIGYVYSDNAGTVGTLLTTGISIRYGSLTTSFAEYQVGVGATLVSGTSYWLVLKAVSVPVGGTISIDTASTGTGLFANSTDGTSWNVENSKSGWFKIYGRTSNGVYGSSTNSYGVQGTSTNSYGVYGTSTNTTGVAGTSTNSAGVSGTSTNSTGVNGTSTSSAGVLGTSTNGAGVNGTSTNSAGVSGTSTNSTGVQGISISSHAVYAVSTNGTAVSARQENSLTTANSGSTLFVRRNGVTNSSGSLNYTAPVVQIIDAPTGTGTANTAMITGTVDSTTRINMYPKVQDGSTAVAYMYDTSNALSNTTAKLLELRNNGSLKLSVLADGTITPGVDDSIDLGTSGLRFDDIYATNATIQTSDIRLKEDIVDLYIASAFLEKLRPVSFKWKDYSTEEITEEYDEQITQWNEETQKDELITVKQTRIVQPARTETHVRKHCGLIAQEVEQAISDIGMTTEDFAALCYDAETDRYAVRYTELIPVLIRGWQDQQAEIKDLKARLAALESK